MVELVVGSGHTGAVAITSMRLTGHNRFEDIGRAEVEDRLCEMPSYLQLCRRNELLRRLDVECPYQVVLPRRQSGGEEEAMKFLDAFVGKFDMYVEDEVFVRHRFADPSDAAFFSLAVRAEVRALQAG